VFLDLFGNILKTLALAATFWAQFRHSFESAPFYFSAFKSDGFLLSDCALF